MQQVRSWAQTLAGAAEASILQPVLQEEGCKILSAFGLCKDHKAKFIDCLHQSLWGNRERINQVSAEMETAISALDGNANATQEDLRLLSADARTNFERIQGKMSQMLNWQRELLHWKNDCHRGSLAHSIGTILESAPGTNYMTSVVNEVTAFRMSLLTYERHLADALENLIYGRMPVSMIPPQDFVTMLESITKKGLHEAIPGEFLMAYYSHESVTAVRATEHGLHIGLNISPHPLTYGVLSAFREVATLRPKKVRSQGHATNWKRTAYSWLDRAEGTRKRKTGKLLASAKESEN